MRAPIAISVKTSKNTKEEGFTRVKGLFQKKLTEPLTPN